jgi:hypothetical protein
MNDIADLYLGFKQIHSQQQQGQVPLAQQPLPQQQLQPVPSQQQQYLPQQQQPQAPINLAEVQPNPVNYNTEDKFKRQISSFWR